jgi:hypothetical protein
MRLEAGLLVEMVQKNEQLAGIFSVINRLEGGVFRWQTSENAVAGDGLAIAQDMQGLVNWAAGLVVNATTTQVRMLNAYMIEDH